MNLFFSEPIKDRILLSSEILFVKSVFKKNLLQNLGRILDHGFFVDPDLRLCLKYLAHVGYFKF